MIESKENEQGEETVQVKTEEKEQENKTKNKDDTAEKVNNKEVANGYESSTTNSVQDAQDESLLGKEEKRFLPSYKKPDAALTFPEKMMSLMKYSTKIAEDPETFCVSWLPDGKSFIIRNPDEFTRKILPKFFKATKFSSFTRKLYRWGFRQVNRGIGPDDPIIFGNEYFQRDQAELMTKMRSTTAASTRRQEADNLQRMLAQKRALDSWEAERDQKRILLDTLLQQQQQQSAMQQQQQQNFAANLTQNFATATQSGPQANPLFVQSLQQQQSQLQPNNVFSTDSTATNTQQSFNLMSAFGNLATANQGGDISANNVAALAGFKPFDILAAQQQQSLTGSNNGFNENSSNGTHSFNPLLNFQLPTSNNSFVLNNTSLNFLNEGNKNGNGINGNNFDFRSTTNNNNNVNMMMLGGNQTNSATTTADIVNAAIHALRYTP